MRIPVDIRKMAMENKAFRRVVDTAKFGQLVLISLLKGEDLGDEMHTAADELYFVVDGEAEIKLDGKTYPFEENDLMIVPAGTRHDITNTGKGDLKLFAMFTTPVHLENEVVPTREKAFASKH
jgi:mannose-6-phosphate isomerase-like protein (cupin superfamily)